MTNTVEQGRLKRNHTGRRLDAGESYEIYTDETRAADDRALMLKVRDSIRALAQPGLFQRLLSKMRQATEGPRVANPIAAVETLGKAYTLSQGERESVLTRLIEDRDYSRWGMVNAVTATANDHKSYDRAVELECLGGRLLKIPAKQWQPIAEAEALSAAA